MLSLPSLTLSLSQSLFKHCMSLNSSFHHQCHYYCPPVVIVKKRSHCTVDCIIIRILYQGYNFYRKQCCCMQFEIVYTCTYQSNFIVHVKGLKYIPYNQKAHWIVYGCSHVLPNLHAYNVIIYFIPCAGNCKKMFTTRSSILNLL